MNLSSLTKRKLIDYIKENYPDVKIDDTLPKVEILELVKDMEPIEVAETKVEEVEVVPAEIVKQPEPEVEVEPFRPRWAPTYRRGMEYFVSLNPEMIHAWNTGRRDSADLKTIEYWVKKRGKLLVRNNARDNFIYLR